MQDDRCNMRIGTYLCINLPPQLTCQTSHDMREERRDFTAPRVGICRVRTRHNGFTHLTQIIITRFGSYRVRMRICVLRMWMHAYRIGTHSCPNANMQGCVLAALAPWYCDVSRKPKVLNLQPIQSRVALQPYPTAWIFNNNFNV